MTGLPSSRDRRQLLAALLGGLGTTGALGLAGCSGGGGQSGLGETSALGTEGQSSPGSKSTPVKVGLLLPLSASTQTALVAKAMREAAELALFESRGAELQLVIKDDKGTEDGARAAATEAIGQGAEIILGPLFAKSVRAAAAVACADEFIEKLPLGYETPLGERGTKLSTGQRQRLSIARAVLKDAPILLLDEPTASLDVETERRVLRNLSAWGRRRAILIVTHRLSTVRHADHIAVLADGRIVEAGTHAELIEDPNGAYRRLVVSDADRAA